MSDIDDLTPHPLPVWRRLTGVAVAYGVSMVAWAILSLGFTSALNHSKPFAAQVLYGGNVITPLLMEDRSIDADVTKQPLDPVRVARLKEAAQRALRSEPMSVDAFAQLARSAQQAGDRSREELYLAEAFRRSFREPKVALQLLNSSLMKSDFGSAMLYMDAILREDISLYPALLPVLMAFGDNPNARGALSATLKANPPWRIRFIHEYGLTSQNQGSLFEIHNALKGSTGATTLVELVYYLHSLVKRDNVDMARKIWYDFHPEVAKEGAPLLFNGNFQQPVNDSPFNWTLSFTENAVMTARNIPIESGMKALHIEFSGRRGTFEHVQQTLLLTKGIYRFQGKVKTDDFQNIRGLVWRLYCGNRYYLNTQSLPIQNQVGDWQEFDMLFDVSDEKCTSQTLALAIDSRIPAEQMATGAVWFRELSIERIEP